MPLPRGATDDDTLDPVGNLVGDVLVVGVQVKLPVGKIRRLQSCSEGRGARGERAGMRQGRSSEAVAAGMRQGRSSEAVAAVVRRSVSPIPPPTAS